MRKGIDPMKAQITRREILILCSGFLFINLFACESKTVRHQDSGGRWARRDFEKLVLGKTKEEVRKILGNPNSVPDDGSYGVRVIWQYNKITYKPPAKDTDNDVRIWFYYVQTHPYNLQPASNVEYSDGDLRGN